MNTYTPQQIIRIGGREWSKNGKHRIYLNPDTWAPMIGLELTHYNTGNICGAWLDGEEISNSRARDILTCISSVYLDVNDNKIHIYGQPGRYWDQVPGWIRTAIATQVAATQPLTTREAATKLGVSPRTIQRRAQHGQLTAHKNDNGHWTITL